MSRTIANQEVKLSNNLTPDDFNRSKFEQKQSNLITNMFPKRKSKAQHHPGMSVAELGKHRTLQYPDIPLTKNTQLKELRTNSKDAISLGSLVRNLSNTTPFFV